ncbi:MAG TPA: amidohydrolase family protein [Longimicrobium sp.]|nr:amidohydrolase family protein [Longimicrobium sp.]
MRAPRFDVHAHLAGIGTGGSGCRVSPAFRRSLTFRALSHLHGMRADAPDADAVWAARLAARVRASEVDHAVALGFDGVYDSTGAPDLARSQVIVPHDWVFRVCRRHPELLPGPSINPHRRDALERLDECIEGGACLIKWLPATQGIDPAHPAHAAFYRRMADARLPLLVHSGGSENTFREIDPRVKELALLHAPLRAGVPVIVAHLAAPVPFRRDPETLPLLRAMLHEFPNLWLDNSGMNNPARAGAIRRLAADPQLAERTLHGSDFPAPCGAVWHAGRLGLARVAALTRIRNPLQREIEIKRALGAPEATLTRAASVLPNLPGAGS